MSDFMVETGGLRRCAEDMFTEMGYAQSGSSWTADHVTSLTAADGGETYADLVAEVRGAGEAVGALFSSLARFWQHSAIEMGQSADYYDATEEEAAAAADLAYASTEPETEEPRY